MGQTLFTAEGAVLRTMGATGISPATEPITVALVEAVAAHAGTDPLELPRLFDVIDPEALHALVASMADGEVSFAFAGCSVTVDSSGTISVSDTVAV